MRNKTAVMQPYRVIATEKALELIARLQQQYGPLMFHQSGGCCDGSQPMCFAAGEFKTGNSDVLLGEVAGCPFYMNRDQFEYWKHTQLILDVTAGRGSSFSLEIPLGVRFLTRSRVFSDQEIAALAHTPPQG
jgi:uncharacterized protein (DUF779 family)